MRVLLVTIDAWRASHASFQPDAERRCTPELAALAEEGVVFSRAFSHGPATPYAFPGIHTSTYPLDDDGYERLGEGRTLLAEALSAAGYRCVGAHSNPWLGAKYGYDRGYDEYRDVGEFDLPLLERGRELLVDRFGLDHPVYRAAQTVYRRLQAPLRSIGGGRADEVRVARRAFSAGGADDDDGDTAAGVTGDAADGATDDARGGTTRDVASEGGTDVRIGDDFTWHEDGHVSGERDVTAAGAADVAGPTSEPDGTDLFVWTHLLAPHAPYDPPQRHREAVGVDVSDATELTTRAQRDPGALSADERAAVEDLYAASVRHADEQVGEILERVDDDVLVVVTADHGEALFERDTVGHPPRLHDELVHVPLVVRPPGGTDPRVVEEVVGHVDVAPTILDYADVPPPPSYRGRSLRPAVEGERLHPEPTVMEVASTEAHPGVLDPEALRVGVRTASRKLVYADGALRGYDLTEDPDERDPIDAPDDGEWTCLRRVLRDRRDAISFEESAVEFDASTEERLRDLGYLE